MKKYFLLTFGCQMNKSDSERIAALIENFGYRPALKIDRADLIIVNMCSVRQSAVDRIYGLGQKFPEFKERNPKIKTILTGCVLKKDKKNFESIFNFILDIKDLAKWPKFLSFNPKLKKIVAPKYSNNFSAFLPISNGCNNACTYCVVPFTRGALACQDHRQILKEAKKLIEKGFKEIWLLGQNVNDYRSPIDSSFNFQSLLKAINKIPGNFWIRFTSPHPKNFSKELIKTMAKCQKLTPYLNLPIQSGDNQILKKMNRSYTATQYKNLVKDIKTAFKKEREGLEKEVAISTDIIVGFPDETKKQFQKTLKLIKDVGFDMAYIAQYSPRPGTLASKTKEKIPQKEKEKRWKEATNLLEKIAEKKNKKFLHKIIDVLVEEKKNGFFVGKSRHHKTVKFKAKNCLLGSFSKAKITKISSFGLEGKLL